MPKDRETHWQFACPECGFGHAELGILAADDEIYCVICFEEAGRRIVLRRWLAVSEGTDPGRLRDIAA